MRVEFVALRRRENGIGEIDPPQVEELDQDTRERGPADRAELRGDAVQRRRGHEVLLLDELWRHRALRTHAQAEGRRDQELRDVERPDARLDECRVRG